MEYYSSDEDIDLGIGQAEQEGRRSARTFKQRDFSEDIDDKVFRERYRVPRAVVDVLEEKLAPKLEHPTERNQRLTPRDQIKIFLHFLGNCS